MNPWIIYSRKRKQFLPLPISYLLDAYLLTFLLNWIVTSKTANELWLPVLGIILLLPFFLAEYWEIKKLDEVAQSVAEEMKSLTPEDYATKTNEELVAIIESKKKPTSNCPPHRWAPDPKGGNICSKCDLKPN